MAHFFSSRKAAKCEKQVQGEGAGAKAKNDNHLDQMESKLRWFMPSPHVPGALGPLDEQQDPGSNQEAWK